MMENLVIAKAREETASLRGDQSGIWKWEWRRELRVEEEPDPRPSGDALALYTSCLPPSPAASSCSLSFKSAEMCFSQSPSLGIAFP
jgi:hypothetical protein